MNSDIRLAFAHPTERAEATAEDRPLDRISLRDHLVDVEIGAFQALQHRAAHLYSEIELVKSAVLKALQELDENYGMAGAICSLAKAKAGEVAKLASQEAVQMHGGIGMTDAFDMGFYMKRARVSAEWLGDYSYHAEQVARLRGF